MDKLLKAYPLPISGFALALFTMANLLGSYSNIYKLIFITIGLVVLTIFILKLIKMPKGVLEVLETNPVAASAFPTFFMASVALAGHIYDYSSIVAKVIYIVMMVLYFAYTLFFAKNFIRNFSINKVFVTWYIVFVGPAIFVVHSRIIDKASWLTGLLTYTNLSFLIMMCIILYRVIIVGYKEEMIRATLIVLAAPASLLFLAYHNYVGNTGSLNYIIIFAISQLYYVWVLFYMPGILKGKLYPTISAMTFPMVTGAFVSKLFFITYPYKIIEYAYYLQLSIALAILALVLFWHVKFLGSELKRK